MGSVYLLPDGYKSCSKCLRVRPMAAFCRNRGTPTGRSAHCRECAAARWQRDYARNNERMRMQASRRTRKFRYGMSHEEYEAMLADQPGGCAICGKATADDAGTTSLAVDHSHLTGQVRGLLCHKCNMALGLFDDDPQRFLRAAEYLSAGFVPAH